MLEYKSASLGGETKIELFYPSHPFPTYLCQKIARLSPGFRELALSQKFSVQFIDFLYLTTLSAQLSSEDTGTLSVTADEVLGMSSLTTLERVLGTALTTYNIYLERRFRTLTGTHQFYVQRRFEVLIAMPDILGCNADALQWACLILRATTEENTDTWRWANARLRAMQVSDCRQRVLERAFLPIPQAASIFEFR